MGRSELNTRKLNRRILSVYWMVIGLAIVIKLINYHFTNSPLMDYLIHFVMIPSGVGVVIVLLAEWSVKKRHRYVDLIVIVAGLLLALNFIQSRPDIVIIRSALFLPILVSGAYFKKSTVTITTAVTIVGYSLLSLSQPEIRNEVTITDHFTLIAMLVIAAFAVLGMMERGEELADHYRQSIENQQELMVKNTLMEKLTKTDSLTGMYNQISFHNFLDELLSHHAQHHFSIQMAIFDLDNFKQVNDTFGHRAGDEVLKQISQLIQGEITADDFAARYGGEEFIVLFVGKPMEKTAQLVEDIRRKIEGISFTVLDGRCVTVSVGLQEYEANTGKEVFFEKADSLLYDAKRKGKNRVITG